MATQEDNLGVRLAAAEDTCGNESGNLQAPGQSAEQPPKEQTKSVRERRKDNRSRFLSTLEPVVAPVNYKKFVSEEEMVKKRHSMDIACDLFASQGAGQKASALTVVNEEENTGVHAPEELALPDGERRKRAVVRRSVEISGQEHLLLMAFKQGATKFNIKPKDGIKFLVEKGLVDDDPKSVASYLHTHTEVLSKRRIGEYIGGYQDFNTKVLTHYLEGLDFTDLSLDSALRIMLREFRLPGEAIVIDRILSAFSKRFFDIRSEACGLKDADAVFVFAFSIIMLNTDLHNPAVEKKLTLTQWMNNNRGINAGDDVPSQVQEDIYNQIKADQIKMQEGDQWEGEVVTFMAPKKSGWLSKMNHGGLQKWSKHWFVLSEHVLYYLNKPNDEHPRLILPMDNVRVGRSLTESDVINFLSADGGAIKCTKKLKEGSMQLQTYTSFTLKAPSAEEREEWFEALTQEVNQDPVLRLQRMKIIAEKERSKNAIVKESTRAPMSFRISKMPAKKPDSKGKSKLTGRGPLDLPEPSAEGWMMKRGENNARWKRRYFAIIDPEEALCLGSALYYFESEDALRRMLELGEQTQKGQVFFSAIKSVNMAFDRVDKAANIELNCDDRTWILRPENPEKFTFWLREFDTFKKGLKETAI